MKQRILVVGGLAAGPSAASKAKRVNPDAEVTLFEQGEHVSYGICEIPYHIGGLIPNAEDIDSLSPATLERTRGIVVRTLHVVEEILPVKKKLVVRGLEQNKLAEYPYDKLILATGSNPRKLNVEGVDGRNVFRVKSLSDGLAIKQYIAEMKPRRCVIVGGGYVGMEFCETLTGLGIEVTLLHLDDYPMTGLELETRQAVKAELERHGIHFVPRQTVTGFRAGPDGSVGSVVTNTGTFAADMVFVSVGVEPNTQLASRIGIRLGRSNGILTDERQVTNIDSIYAAGDCCEVKNVVNNKFVYIPLATYASRQGRVAGENAAGGVAVFKGAIRSIAVKIFGLEVAQVGLSFEESRESGIDAHKISITADTRVRSYPGNEKVNIVAIVDRQRQRLVGANVYGGNGAVLRANLLGFAIQQKMNLEDISHLDLVYSPPFSPLWDPILVLGNQFKKR